MGLFSKITKPVGDILNGLTGVDSQMKSQNDFNTRMWNLQNEYNTPSAQLARMREAGIDINPTSYALGTGNLSNTAALVSSGHGSPAGNPISQLMGVAQGLQGVRESKARTELDNANARGIQANIDRIGVDNENTRERTRQMKNDNDFFEQHGYYPTHADTPVLSGYTDGPVGQFVGSTVVPELKTYVKNAGKYEHVNHVTRGLFNFDPHNWW